MEIRRVNPGRASARDTRRVHTAVNINRYFVVALLAAYPFASFARGPLRSFCRAHEARCTECGYRLKGLRDGSGGEPGQERSDYICARVMRKGKKTRFRIVVTAGVVVNLSLLHFLLQIWLPSCEIVQSNRLLDLLWYPGDAMGILDAMWRFVASVILWSIIITASQFFLFAVLVPIFRLRLGAARPGQESRVVHCPECNAICVNPFRFD